MHLKFNLFLAPARLTTNLSPRNDEEILVKLGTKGVNVGDMASTMIYHNVYTALLNACKFALGSSCMNRAQEIPVYVQRAPDTEPVVETLTVTVTAANWRGNLAIFRLLVGSVAGAFERGTWNKQSNCHDIQVRHKKIVQRITHCNSVDTVEVAFPGGYHMNVSFGAGTMDVGFDCWKIVDAVKGEMYRLLPEIVQAVKKGSLWADVECKV